MTIRDFVMFGIACLVYVVLSIGMALLYMDDTVGQPSTPQSTPSFQET